MNIRCSSDTVRCGRITGFAASAVSGTGSGHLVLYTWTRGFMEPGLMCSFSVPLLALRLATWAIRKTDGTIPRVVNMTDSLIRLLIYLYIYTIKATTKTIFVVVV